MALGAFWAIGQAVPTPSEGRILIAVAPLALLFQAGFLGGWWLIPADLTWLAIEWRARNRGRRQVGNIAS